MAKDGGGQPTSMLQGLQSILGALGGMMAAPDADVPFLTGLQHVIVDQIKKKTTQAVAGQQQANQVAPGGGAGMSGFGAGAGAPGGPMTPPGSQPPPPGMGAPGPGGIGAPNPNELGRVLGGVGQAS